MEQKDDPDASTSTGNTMGYKRSTKHITVVSITSSIVFSAVRQIVIHNSYYRDERDLE